MPSSFERATHTGFDMQPSAQHLSYTPYIKGAVNWIGLATLTRKEVLRFTNVAAQTIFAPVVSTLLFYFVFSLALGGNNRMIEGIPYMAFLVPGLIMMSIAQNAFGNTSSSLVISKVQGNIVDVLMPPLSPAEMATGYVLGGVMRGLSVGALSIVTMLFIAPIHIDNIFMILFHAVAGSMMLALLGFIGGIWAQKFDHLATITNFIIMPATFLSGTFYSVHQLPDAWHFLAAGNPFFYMIDGFRSGFIGHADGSLPVGIAVMIGVNLALGFVALALLKSGYKLRT